MEDACRSEIERLHVFFVQWFGGNLPREAFEQECSVVFSPDMRMIPPSGIVLEHSQLIERLLAAYARHEGKQFSIEILNVETILQQDDLCIVSYEELQLVDGEGNSRRSTATFRAKENTPCGVEWLHLQETSMNQVEKQQEPKQQQETIASSSPDTIVPRPALVRKQSLVSQRRHLSPQLPLYQATTIKKEGEVIGVELNCWKISSTQSSIGDDAWFTQATERLQEMAQPPPPTIEHAKIHSVTHRHVCLPEMVFPRAHITLEQQNGLKLKFGAYAALLEWSKAHQGIPLGSSIENRGVSVMQVADAKLWSDKHRHSQETNHHSNFHYDWTFSTPFTCNTTMDVSWTPLESSGMNMALLQDQSVPILLFDEVVLYEDDLHDNGQVTLTCKVRVMPTCVFCLQRLWVRVDGVMLRVRDTRVCLEFCNGIKFKVFRDVVWRQCLWQDLEMHGLSSDLRSWCPETGGVSENEWQAAITKIPEVELPSDVPAHAVLDETCS